MMKKPVEELITRFLILSTDLDEEIQIETSFQIKLVCLEINSEYIVDKLIKNVMY